MWKIIETGLIFAALPFLALGAVAAALNWPQEVLWIAGGLILAPVALCLGAVAIGLLQGMGDVRRRDAERRQREAAAVQRQALLAYSPGDPRDISQP